MKRTGLLLLVIVFTLCVSAQTVKKYSGQMSKPEWISAELFECNDPYDINGYYSYYEDKDENRIIHGEFMISYKTGFVDGVSRYEIKGSFVRGKQDGKWEMKAILINGKYASNYLYQFNYTNGILNGPFQIYDNEVEIFGNFTNGVISDRVITKNHYMLSNNYEQVEGKVNSQGNPHGIWTEKEVSDKAVPKDITRLYYDGNLVYRREKDLSSRKTVYTYSISDDIRVPADIEKISDTIIKGKDYINVAGIICYKDTETLSYLYDVVRETKIATIYPSIQNWKTFLDTNYYPNLVKEEQEEQIRKEEQIREEERRQRAEEARKRREEEARLNAEMKAAWREGQDYYSFCWGGNASSKFETLYKEIGLDSINAMLDSISRYEYENYTIAELYTNNPNFSYYYNNPDFRNHVLSVLRRKKKLNKVFKTYEAYIQCKKGGGVALKRELRW